MSDEYELQVLKTVAARFISEIPMHSEIHLKNIETSRDEIVYSIAQRIYSQSGLKFPLPEIRKLLDSRIKATRNKLEANLRFVEEPLKNQKFIESDQNDEFERSRINLNIGKFGGDEETTKIFLRVQKIISENLGVDEQEVNLDCHLSNHLGADDVDLVELVMALEEEFGIEINDEVSDSRLGINPNFNFSSWGSGSSPSSSYGAGPECIVRNFVSLICEKTVI